MNQTIRSIAIVAVFAAVAIVAVAALSPRGTRAQAGPSAAAVDWTAEQEAFAVPAGQTYTAPGDLATWQASLSVLWTWDGAVGTYIDGQTQVRAGEAPGGGIGVEIVKNASTISDGCLVAQLLYGLPGHGPDTVRAACAGIWTQEWAESQTDAGQ
jgi:hypothetical protein